VIAKTVQDGRGVITVHGGERVVKRQNRAAARKEEEGEAADRGINKMMRKSIVRPGGGRRTM